MKPHSKINRRIALKLFAGMSVASLSGCLGSTLDSVGSGGGPITSATVEETSLDVTLVADSNVGQLNVIAPNGDLFGKREIATGVTNASFDLGTDYEPGEYRILAVDGEETLGETTLEIRPELKIRDVGLYRNHPEKDWEAVYGESDTKRRINSEAFVTVENTGTGPEKITQLRFDGDLPHLAENYHGSGIYEREAIPLAPNESVNLYSETLPFGYHSSSEGMGCKPSGVSGTFTVALQIQVLDSEVSKSFSVNYSGSDSMNNCTVSISEEGDG